MGNLVINPHGPPVEVTECEDAVVCGNLPVDPLPSKARDSVATA